MRIVSLRIGDKDIDIATADLRLVYGTRTSWSVVVAFADWESLDGAEPLELTLVTADGVTRRGTANLSWTNQQAASFLGTGELAPTP